MLDIDIKLAVLTMKILVTGAAGFIGAAVVQRLFNDNMSISVVGLDNINDYYDPTLKFGRLAQCGGCSHDSSRPDSALGLK